MKRIDEGVCPSDFYTKSEIARFEGIPQERMAKLARDTLAVLQKRAQAEGIEDLREYAGLFNTVKNGLVADRQVNFFFWHTRLEPIAHLFRLFVVRRKAAKSNAVHLYADFGVRKTYYEAYKQTGQAPALQNRGRLPKHGAASTRESRSKVEFVDGGRVDIPQNAVYARFRAGIEAANRQAAHKVTVPEIVLQALAEYMEKRPAVFGEALYCLEGLPPVERCNTSLYIENINPEVVRRLYDFIQRYNAAGNHPLTMARFVEGAIQAHLERMPLAYLGD